jgi:hypothetical protein
MHECPALASAIKLHPSIIAYWENRSTYVFPLHNGEAPNCRAESGAQLVYCPWCGMRIGPDIEKVDDDDNPNPFRFEGPGRSLHCCETMNETVSSQHLVVAFDAEQRRYLRPIFDGTRRTNCLGSRGVLLRYCPWSADHIAAADESADFIDLIVPLPGDVTNPQF